MKIYFLIVPIILVFSCAENQTTSNESAQEVITEQINPPPPSKAIVEAAIKQVQAIEESKKEKEISTQIAQKKEISGTEKETQEANIKKIIDAATATKPTAQSKPSLNPEVKKTTKPIVKKEEPKPVSIETTQPSAKIKKTPATPKKISHTTFDNYLKKYVSISGNVNYTGMKADYQPLKNYLSELGKSTPKSDWNRNEKLTYWLNAYNAFTIDLILTNYPISKITDLDGGSPWKVKRIVLEGKKYSLDQIENAIIRPQFKDPRIHFAVNCAAKSCPTLLNGAFLPSKLSSQLESQTKKFINNPSFNIISTDGAKVSKIFEWYGEDFGNLKEYLNKYSTEKLNSNSKIEFEEYNWSLNGK